MSRSERMKFLRENLSTSQKESKGDDRPGAIASVGGLNVPGAEPVRRTSKQNLEDFFNKLQNKNTK